jgi:hypothetical protein
VKQKVSENAHRVGGERGELRTTASLQGAQTAVIGAELPTHGHAEISA